MSRIYALQAQEAKRRDAGGSQRGLYGGQRLTQAAWVGIICQ
jgi:hypothetical protein